ncbi:hypothetical protein G834_01943 [Escherichia coli HVH 182 (4-0985554)]|nr:hypothetical protein G834_01943 [Escherichia coli HVH 182 (4-0985554)]
MIKKIFALPVIEQISPVLSRRKLDELDLIVVDHPQVKASFALQGAHLLSWKPAGEEEVLWLSNNKMASPFAVAYRFAGRGLVRLHNKICLRTVLPATCRGR